MSFKEILTYFCEELKMLKKMCFKIIEKNTEQQLFIN
jgi:hypothetical protein